MIKTVYSNTAMVWKRMLVIINSESLPISQNLSDIIAIAKNKPKLRSEVTARVGDFAGHSIFGKQHTSCKHWQSEIYITQKIMHVYTNTYG